MSPRWARSAESGRRGLQQKKIFPNYGLFWGVSSRGRTRSNLKKFAARQSLLPREHACGGPGCGLAQTLSSTRPLRKKGRLRAAACAIIVGDGSTPATKPSVARWASIVMHAPGPKPISRTRSRGCTSNISTKKRLVGRFVITISNPAIRPRKPLGLRKWARKPEISVCWVGINRSN